MEIAFLALFDFENYLVLRGARKGDCRIFLNPLPLIPWCRLAFCAG